MADEIEEGVISQGLLEHYLEMFKFRDGDGRYWAYAPGRREWGLPSGAERMPAGSPQGRLEGPDALTDLSPQTAGADAAVEPVEGEREPGDQDPVSGFETRMDGIREAYQAGRINSAAAEQLSGQVFLVDQEAKFWTVGFRSGYWYQRGEGKWIFSRQKPSADSLLDMEAQESNEEVEEAYLEFVMNEGEPLPEPVADEWSPPEGPAEAIFLCPICAKVDLGTVEECRFCGTSFGTQKTESASPGPKFCGHCGAPVSGKTRFCTQCGEEL